MKPYWIGWAINLITGVFIRASRGRYGYGDTETQGGDSCVMVGAVIGVMCGATRSWKKQGRILP